MSHQTPLALKSQEPWEPAGRVPRGGSALRKWGPLRTLGQFHRASRASSTTEARLPPEHVDVLPGTGLGIVGKGGTHSLPPPLSATVHSSPCTVGKEAGLVVLIGGHLPRKGGLSAGRRLLLTSSPPLASTCDLWKGPQGTQKLSGSQR